MPNREQTFLRQQWLISQVQAVCPITGISFDTAPPTAQYAAGATVQQEADAQAIINAFDVNTLTPSEQRVIDFSALSDRADLLARLNTSTPAQIDTWLTNNVTNLAQARAVLASIIKILALNIQR